MCRICMVSVVSAAGVWLATLAPPQDTGQRPFGLEKRLPLTPSRVVGSPDPPPPYRVKRAFPDLKVNFPIAIVHQPGSNRLLVIAEEWSYGPVKIQRFVDDPKTTEVETLLDLNAVAYSIVFHPDFATN